MLQREHPQDFVIATGEQFSVRTFIEWTAAELGIDLAFSGSGVEEVATVAAIKKINGEMRAPALEVGDVILRIDPKYFRPTEVETLLGDPSRAKEVLGWVPTITAEEMCTEMTRHDLSEAKKMAVLRANGFNVAHGK
jgi:GDPmannose 4,6-dehydratase